MKAALTMASRPSGYLLGMRPLLPDEVFAAHTRSLELQVTPEGVPNVIKTRNVASGSKAMNGLGA